MFRRLTALFALLLTAACGTVTHGPLQRIEVDSDPAGALVIARGCGPRRADLRTPATVWVSRRATRCTLRIDLEGYEPKIVLLHRRVSDKFTDNTISPDTLCGPDLHDCNSLTDLFIVGAIAGLIVGTGMAVDGITGAMFEQTPNQIDVSFHEEPAPEQD